MKTGSIVWYRVTSESDEDGATNYTVEMHPLKGSRIEINKLPSVSSKKGDRVTYIFNEGDGPDGYLTHLGSADYILTEKALEGKNQTISFYLSQTGDLTLPSGVENYDVEMEQFKPSGGYYSVTLSP